MLRHFSAYHKRSSVILKLFKEIAVYISFRESHYEKKYGKKKSTVYCYITCRNVLVLHSYGATEKQLLYEFVAREL